MFAIGGKEAATYRMQYSPLRNYIISATQNITTLSQRRKIFYLEGQNSSSPQSHYTLFHFNTILRPSLGIRSDAFHLHGR